MCNASYQQLIDKYYPAGSPLRDIYVRHCRSVAELALEIAVRKQLPLDQAEIEAAAMLHDIGIFLTDAPGIHCHGTEPYLAHGRLGADLLRSEGYPESWARVAERHTGAGLTPTDVARYPELFTPDRCYMPETLLEKLICYADKFYSKSGDMQQKSLDRVRNSIAKFGEPSAERFEQMHKLFAHS